MRALALSLAVAFAAPAAAAPAKKGPDAARMEALQRLLEESEAGAPAPKARKEETPEEKAEKAERKRVFDEKSAAEARAGRLSKEGDYAGAAAALDAFAEANDKVRASLQSEVEAARSCASALRRRAGWAARAGDSPDAARSLLRDLLMPECWLERAELRDERVQALLKSLRAIDRDFAAAFSRRPLAVSVQGGNGSTPVHEQLLLDRAIGGLRALGFDASAGTEGEHVRLQADLRLQGSLGALLGDKSGELSMKSCRAGIAARWAGGAGAATGFDYSMVAMHIEEDTCYREAMRKAGERAAQELLMAWLRENR